MKLEHRRRLDLSAVSYLCLRAVDELNGKTFGDWHICVNTIINYFAKLYGLCGASVTRPADVSGSHCVHHKLI